MSISMKMRNLRVTMIQSIKDILQDSSIKVSTKFDSARAGTQIRVNYMGSDRVQTMFLSADYSIDILCDDFDEAEVLSYRICDELQDYKKNGICDVEIMQYPIEYLEEGITGELRTISLEALIRPENR